MFWYQTIWNILILGSTGYVVFGLDYSGWWWILALIIWDAGSYRESK